MNVQLPDFIIADLYKNNLVITEDTVAKKTLSDVQFTKNQQEKNEEIGLTENKKWFLGDHKKKVTILVNNSDAIFMDDESLQLLSGILSACKLNIGDVAIINLHQTKINYNTLKQQLPSDYIFMFDINPLNIQLPVTFPMYQVQQYDNCTFLFAASLHNMKGDSKEAKVEKSKLWISLKKTFNI
jgi:hypothetical protein